MNCSDSLLQGMLDDLVRRAVALLGTPEHPTRSDERFNLVVGLRVDEREPPLRRCVAHRGHRHIPLWTLAASTGMRRGELLGLRWRDVDLKAQRLSVRQTIISVGYEVIRSDPKTAKGARTIDLDGHTVRALRAHRAEQRLERQLLALPEYGEGLVFCRENGEPYHPDLVRQSFERRVSASAVPRIRFHDLRHTHATLMLQAGVRPKVVSERLGHSTVAFTMDVYAHVIPGMQADAAETFGQLVFGLTDAVDGGGDGDSGDRKEH